MIRNGRLAASILLALLFSACTTVDKKPPATGAETATYPPTAEQGPATIAPETKQCREFQRDVTIAGKTEKAYGTACLQPDGTWKQEGATRPEPAAQAQSEVARSFPYQGLPPGRYYHGHSYYPVYRPYHYRFGYGFRHRGFGYWSHY